MIGAAATGTEEKQRVAIPIDRKDRVVSLHILDFGLFRVHSGNRVIGICGYLIKTASGRSILVDTGFPEKYYRDTQAATLEDRLDSFGEMVSLTEANSLERQLELAGIALGDVDCLILSHTHIDHVGRIGDFPHAPLVIGKAERAFPKPLYWKGAQPLDWPEVETVEVEGDLDICEGLQLLSTPGHSPGHLSLLVGLPETGPVLLTADAISRPAEVEERFAGSWNEAEAIASADRLLALARERSALIIYGHWPEQWPTLRKAPDFYG